MVDERSVWVQIAFANTDTAIMTIPKNKIAEITKVEVRNPLAANARVRIWDQFSDFEAVPHSRVKFDHTVVAGDSIIADVEGSKQAIGSLVAQSDQVTIQINVGVKLR